MKCIFSAKHRCLHERICSRRLKTELCKEFEKLGLQPRRKLINISSNLYITIANPNKLSEWSDEELQSILSSWQYKSMKVKLTSLGMYTAREKDHCAGFDCSVKDGNKLMNVLNLQTQESQQMTGYTKGMGYFYAKMTNNHY